MRSEHSSRYHTQTRWSLPRSVFIWRIPYVITVDPDDQVVLLRQCSVYCDRGIIQAVTSQPKFIRRYLRQADMVYDASIRGGIVVTPGLINAHAHPPMYLLRSTTLLHNEQATTEQSLEIARRIERSMTVAEQTSSALGDFTEQQKFGTTTILSHYHTPAATRAAAQQTRVRLVDAVSLASKTDPRANLRTAIRSLSGQTALITPALTMHTMAQITKPELLAVKRLLQRWPRVRLTVHCGETMSELEATIQRHGQRPVAVLAAAGLLGPRLIVSHAVHFTSDEIRLLVKKRVGIVHLPTSNRMHKSGQFRYADFYAAGGADRIALGTDSVISKSKLDMVSEALQSKMEHQDSLHPVTYEQLFKMLTVNGAQVVGLPRVGKIIPGYYADLAFWKLKDRMFIPFAERHPKTLLGNFITHGGYAVRDLMVHGQFVISNRRHNFVNESRLLTQLQQAHTQLRRRIHLTPSYNSERPR